MARLVTSRQIAAALLSLVGDGVQAEHIGQAAAAYLVSNRRSKDYDAVKHDMLELRAAEGTVEAVALSAYELSDTVKRELKVILSEQFKPGSQVVLEQAHDPSLVGGVRLEAPGLQLDLSIKHRLQQLTAATMQTER